MTGRIFSDVLQVSTVVIFFLQVKLQVLIYLMSATILNPKLALLEENMFLLTLYFMCIHFYNVKKPINCKKPN